MVWLNAALAFVVAMILFSTIVSAATESLHRIFHLRERGLRSMLERLFDDVVWPRLSVRLAPRPADTVRAAFVAGLTRNRAIHETGPARWFGYWFAPRSLTALPTLEFVQRLAETDVGRALAGAGTAQIDAAVGELARQFERYGGDASAYFQQRAKAVSITIAVAIAFALNVDAVRLFSNLLVNPELTAKLIAEGNAIAASPPAETAAGGAASAAPPADREAAAASRPEQAGAANDEADITKLLQDARREAAAAAAFGLPVGPAYFPWCRDQGVDRACAALREARARGDGRKIAVLWIAWLAFTLVSGLLIGLGGPFWFDAFVRLSSLVQVVQSVAAGGRRAAVATDSDHATAPLIAPPATPAEAFRAFMPPPPRPPRALLSPTGRPL
jgi:hypothetical protein